jgi:hypothetical protein
MRLVWFEGRKDIKEPDGGVSGVSPEIRTVSSRIPAKQGEGTHDRLGDPSLMLGMTKKPKGNPSLTLGMTKKPEINHQWNSKT